jgi:hypothetical protein
MATRLSPAMRFWQAEMGRPAGPHRRGLNLAPYHRRAQMLRL